MTKVRSGLDVALSKIPRDWQNARLGVLSHQASIASDYQHLIPLLRARKLQVTTLFAPEHGLWGSAQDQVPVMSDSGLRLYSLYGDTRAPTEEMLAHVDILICDLQDVGSRYYTFAWTMALAMQACAKYGKKFVVLDRPNPINGTTLEGPVLDLAYASFVGLYPVPVRHGLTMGELALWMNEGLGVGSDLEVIAMKNWRRAMYYEETGLPWVFPSPNMPTVDTAVVYPGGCLLEGTNLSEGRGSTKPFEMFGAPYVNPESFVDALTKETLSGVAFRACRFEPTFHKFHQEICGGVQVHVLDRNTFEPFLTYAVILQNAWRLFRPHVDWRPPPYEYETVKLPIDILCGDVTVRTAVESGHAVKTLRKAWREACAEFSRKRKPFLLYN